MTLLVYRYWIIAPAKMLQIFKFRFKKVSQGQFDSRPFRNSYLKTRYVQNQNPLKIEFVAAAEDDAIQITIDIENLRTILPLLKRQQTKQRQTKRLSIS